MTEDQFAVYRTAKSTRPAWANALIIAGVLFVAGLIFAVTSGLGTALWFFGASLTTAVIAGIAALAGISRRVP
jgi:hypothetical protein